MDNENGNVDVGFWADTQDFADMPDYNDDVDYGEDMPTDAFDNMDTSKSSNTVLLCMFLT